MFACTTDLNLVKNLIPFSTCVDISYIYKAYNHCEYLCFRQDGNNKGDVLLSALLIGSLWRVHFREI